MAFLLITDDDMCREADLLCERHRPDPYHGSADRRCEHCRERWPCPGIKLAARAYALFDPYPGRHRMLESIGA